MENTKTTAITTTTINGTAITLAVAEKAIKTMADKSSEYAVKMGMYLLAVKSGKLFKSKYKSLLEFYNAFGISTSDASRKMQIARKLFEETINEDGTKSYIWKMEIFKEYNISQLAEIARYTDDTMLIDIVNQISPEMKREDIRTVVNDLIMEREIPTDTEQDETEEEAETEAETEEAEAEETETKETEAKTDGANLVDVMQELANHFEEIMKKAKPTKKDNEFTNYMLTIWDNMKKAKEIM